MNFVIKKDGTKEPFDVEKIKNVVNMAATQAGLSPEEASSLSAKAADSVVESLAGTDEAPVADVRNKVISFLEAEAPAVAEAWKNFEAGK